MWLQFTAYRTLAGGPPPQLRGILRDVALPFVAGMALAYLTDPLARRAETFGISRTLSALIILTLVIVAVVVGVMVTERRGALLCT